MSVGEPKLVALRAKIGSVACAAVVACKVEGQLSRHERLARIPMAWHEQPMIDAMKSAHISWWRSV
jgi:hypothetical protein